MYTDSHVVISIYKFGATCFCLKRQKLYLLKKTVSVVATYKEEICCLFLYMCIHMYVNKCICIYIYKMNTFICIYIMKATKYNLWKSLEWFRWAHIHNPDPRPYEKHEIPNSSKIFSHFFGCDFSSAERGNRVWAYKKLHNSKTRVEQSVSCVSCMVCVFLYIFSFYFLFT